MAAASLYNRTMDLLNTMNDNLGTAVTDTNRRALKLLNSEDELGMKAKIFDHCRKLLSLETHRIISEAADRICDEMESAGADQCKVTFQDNKEKATISVKVCLETFHSSLTKTSDSCWVKAMESLSSDNIEDVQRLHRKIHKALENLTEHPQQIKQMLTDVMMEQTSWKIFDAVNSMRTKMINASKFFLLDVSSRVTPLSEQQGSAELGDSMERIVDFCLRKMLSQITRDAYDTSRQVLDYLASLQTCRKSQNITRVKENVTGKFQNISFKLTTMGGEFTSRVTLIIRRTLQDTIPRDQVEKRLCNDIISEVLNAEYFSVFINAKNELYEYLEKEHGLVPKPEPRK